MTRCALGVAAFLFLLGPTAAEAQKKPAKPAAKAAAKAAPAQADGAADKDPKARLERGRGGVKVYRLEEIKVEGRIQKPTAFYVLQRSSLNYELESLKQQFVPSIIKAVSQDPF